MVLTLGFGIVATILTACGSSATSSPTPAKASKSTVAPASSIPVTTTTVPTIQPYMLAIQDLPTGWSVDNTPQSSSTSCYSDPVTKAPSLAYAHEDFAQGGTLPELAEELGYFANGAEAFSSINATLASCSHFTEQDGSQTVSGTMGAMSSPTYGDQSAAYTAAFTLQGVNVTQGFVMVRKGNYIALVALGDIGSLDSSTLEGFVAQAVGKLPA
jgi:hypothetical protein